jgi:D-alanyl-D-alanine carboxypeptidase/D-alanyl-D-alanine-endopeptidase (penicillin-binding protein 4)
MITIFKSRVLSPVLFSVATLLFSCSTDKIISKKVAKQFDNSEVIKKYLVGFELYDMSTKKAIYQKDADKYFMPASNTKLYTFYASLKMLPENLPSLKYIERNDSLIFWGTGNPALLHTTIKDRSALDFLTASNKKIFYAPGRYDGDVFASGWAWDDYGYYYGPEINEFPIGENMITTKYITKDKFSVEPKIFASNFKKDSTKTRGDFFINRDYVSNSFTYPAVPIKPGYDQQTPYRTSAETTVAVLSDTLHKEVKLINMKIPKNAKVIYGAKRDTVLKHMMLPSDNFVAEHLMMLCSNEFSDTLNVGKGIRYAVRKYMGFLPDAPKWVDGSGLSRKNLFTPRDMVALLDTIYHTVNDPKKLFDMMPAGGKSGTLRNAYPKTIEPFVFGKTGSLNGVHNQSGYVLTKKGKTFIYSFMNNNFVNPTSEVRAEMVRIMTYIHENF